MGKFDDAVESAKAQCKAQKTPVNEELLRAVCKSLGPSLYKRDANTVAATQKHELETIKKNFLIKKLGLEDGPKLDKAIQKAIDKIGRSNRNKQRGVFYYILVRDLKQESKFI